ncbi:MAG TPA: UDP-N-acetylmuramate dehydrogenase [Alphaproteobacteria bacterium]|nr:UDP-N-acetylmuramate dehydrogenase [Alphaproteobacteria bacterium]
MIPPAARHALSARLGERIRFEVAMSRHTSLRVGGPADALATPADREELRDLLRICAEHDLPRTFLGAGFNLLVRDGGLDGVVVCMKKLRGLEVRPGPAVYAEAGVSHASITRFCVDRGLSGLEFGAGIPGTIGGWIAMNAGIGAREQKDVVREIEVVSADGSACLALARDALDFRYRELAGLPEGSVIVAALFGVTPSTPDRVKAEVDRLLARRHATQPLDVPSCGSVFRNPDGDFAGRLIERAGLKGERIGGAEISGVHANFIANVGGASAADVLALIERARDRVAETSGVRLETEVRIVGRAA